MSAAGDSVELRSDGTRLSHCVCRMLSVKTPDKLIGQTQPFCCFGPLFVRDYRPSAAPNIDGVRGVVAVCLSGCQTKLQDKQFCFVALHLYLCRNAGWSAARGSRELRTDGTRLRPCVCRVQCVRTQDKPTGQAGPVCSTWISAYAETQAIKSS